MKIIAGKSVSITVNIKRDVFHLLNFSVLAHLKMLDRCFMPKGLIPFSPAIKADGLCAASIHVVHHLEEKLRRLELQVFVGTTFSLALA